MVDKSLMDWIEVMWCSQMHTCMSVILLRYYAHDSFLAVVSITSFYHFLSSCWLIVRMLSLLPHYNVMHCCQNEHNKVRQIRLALVG